MAKKKTKVEDVINETDVVELENVNINLDDIKESIKNVDTTINSNMDETLNEIVEEFKEEIKPIEELTTKVNDLCSNHEAINKALSSSQEEAENVLKEEIKKAESLKAEVEKIIAKQSTRKLSPNNMNNWWNGTGCDISLW